MMATIVSDMGPADPFQTFTFINHFIVNMPWMLSLMGGLPRHRRYIRVPVPRRSGMADLYRTWMLKDGDWSTALDGLV